MAITDFYLSLFKFFLFLNQEFWLFSAFSICSSLHFLHLAMEQFSFDSKDQQGGTKIANEIKIKHAAIIIIQILMSKILSAVAAM